jgi:hypothetical protein
MSDVQNAGIFLARELEQKLPTVYEQKFPQYWAAEGMFHQASATLERGAASVTETIIEGRGEALPLAEYNSSFPTNEVASADTTFKVIDFVTTIEYTFQQLWAAEKAGKDLVGLKLRQAYKTMQEKIHRHAVFGNSKYGHQGLFGNNLVTTIASAYNPNTSTWQQDLDFFRAQLSDLADSINNTAQTGYILISPKLRFKLASTYQTGDSGATVLQALMQNFGIENGGFLKGIIGANECRAAELELNGVQIAGTNLDRVVFVPDTQDYMERLYYPVIQEAPQLRDLSYRVFLLQGTSEIIAHYPKEARYVTHTRML